MLKLYYFVGPAASGKSTKAKKIWEEDEKSIYLSSDNLRKELLGDVSDQSKNGWIFEQMSIRARAALTNGYSVIYDATNLQLRHRLVFLQSIKNIPCEKICYVMAATPERLYANDMARDRHVGKEVIDKQIKQFQCPQYFEGWDRIYFDTVEPKYFDGIEWLVKLVDSCHIPHDTPYHKYQIYEHMQETLNNLIKIVPDNSRLHFAGAYHDVGKPFCKSLYNARGRRDEDGIYHYIGHANAGAYLMLLAWREFFDQPEKLDAMMEVICLINYHMEKYIRKGKYEQFKQLLPEKVAYELDLLNIADKKAH